MKLTYEQIKAITCGAVRILEEEGGLRFWRFTEHQEYLYTLPRPVIGKVKNYRPTSITSAGVRMAFRTDSSTLFLSVDVKKGCPRTFFSFDVVVDGKLIGSMDNFGNHPFPQGEPKTPYPLGLHEKTFDLGTGEKMVEVFFPWSVCPIVQEVSPADGSFVEPVKRPKKWLVFGDSITQGYDILRPSQHHIPKTAEKLNAEVFNKGIGGEIFFPPLADSPDDFQPDYITVAYGTNDLVHVDGSRFNEDCHTFFANLRKHYPNAKIACVTPIWRASFDGAENFDTIENLEKRMAAAVSTVPGVALVRGYDFIPQDTALLSDFTTHPNDAGFAYYSENFWEGIKNAFDL